MSKIVSDTLNEIQAINLSYMMLAQRTLRDDKEEGMSRLGISEPIADRLLQLSVDQMTSLSRSTQLMLRFKFDDKAVLSALSNKGSEVISGTSIGLAAEETAG